MIRKAAEGDLEELADIWLAANQEAHAFIPADWWQRNLEPVKAALAQAEVWAAVEEHGIQGFIGLQGDYIAGLFVRREARSQGIGRRLMEQVKAHHPRLCLRVYQKNLRAEGFYRREGFAALETGVDPDTGEAEILMVWPGADEGGKI